MSVKVHEAFSIDSFQDRLLWYDDFLGDQLQDEWGSVGSAVVIDQQTGGIVRITTGAVNGNWARINWLDIRSLLVSKKVSMELRVKLNHNTYVSVSLMLFFDWDNRIYFTFNEVDGAPDNWDISCVDGGAATLLDTGIITDTSYHIFRIECLPTGEVHFYIDGVETANSPITTNIPDDAGDYFQPNLYIQTREDAAKSMDIDYCVVRQEI